VLDARLHPRVPPIAALGCGRDRGVGRRPESQDYPPFESAACRPLPARVLVKIVGSIVPQAGKRALRVRACGESRCRSWDRAKDEAPEGPRVPPVRTLGRRLCP
jgi:hypothetical protein